MRVPPSSLFKGMPTTTLAISTAGMESSTWVMLTRSRKWFTATWPQWLPDTTWSKPDTMLRPAFDTRVITGSVSRSNRTETNMIPSMMA